MPYPFIVEDVGVEDPGKLATGDVPTTPPDEEHQGMKPAISEEVPVENSTKQGRTVPTSVILTK